MTMHFDYKIEGGDFTRAGYASSQVKRSLKQLNVDPKVIKRVVVALYEAEVNIVAHAYHGNIHVEINTEKINMTLIDEGPGIANIEQAMQMGYSTATPEVREMGFGAGMGLPNIKNNSDEFRIESEVGVGTKLNIVVYINK